MISSKFVSVIANYHHKYMNDKVKVGIGFCTLLTYLLGLSHYPHTLQTFLSILHISIDGKLLQNYFCYTFATKQINFYS